MAAFLLPRLLRPSSLLRAPPIARPLPSSQRLLFSTRPSHQPPSPLEEHPLASLNEPRWEEPLLEHFILKEWPSVGDAFPRRRWLRRLRRDLALRFEHREQVDRKWLKEAGKEKLMILIGHLGKEGQLDTPDLLPLKEAVTTTLAQHELLPHALPAPREQTIERDVCFNCGVRGHWKGECPEPPRQGRSGMLSASEEARMKRRAMLVASAGERRPRKSRTVAEDTDLEGWGEQGEERHAGWQGMGGWEDEEWEHHPSFSRSSAHQGASHCCPNHRAPTFRCAPVPRVGLLCPHCVCSARSHPSSQCRHKRSPRWSFNSQSWAVAP